MNYPLNILIFATLTVFTSCGQKEATPAKESLAETVTTSEKTDPSPEKTTLKQLGSNDLLYAWVDKLNIREAPNAKGKIIAEAASGEALTFTGERSPKSEEIVLRGVVYDEPWLQVTTAGNETGWVFGGAVKRKDEKKGNAVITNDKFDYPRFGLVDLTTWKKLGTKTEGEEVDYTITTYEKGGQLIEITDSDMGDYHYGKTITIMDNQKKVLKTRKFSFTADTEFRELSETVEDYTAEPATVFSRKQRIKTHFQGLNARPQMVNGEWTKGTPESTEPASATLQSFTFNDCITLLEKDLSCSCSFSTGDPYKGPPVFISDGGENACVNVNGEMNALYPDWEERNYQAELKKLSAADTWISVENSGITYFGKPLAEHRYENSIDLLTDVILASGKDISTIPIKNTADGMVIREIRDAANEAISKAKEYRSKIDGNPLNIQKYDNRKYDVILRYYRLTQYEGEANQFSGTITLLPNRSSEILATRTINGTCGC